jgi:L1 cell adhesion molecule like protein
MNPEENMQAAEDFFGLILEAHIVAAANTLMEDDSTLEGLANKIVDHFVKLSPKEILCTDQVNVYACELLTLGLVWQAYYDASKEGDGKRIMKLFKYLMLIFKKSNCRNYAKETAITLTQVMFLLSERKAAQIIHSRFINTKGRRGCNIPCDLFNEHLNRQLKRMIQHLGSNVQPCTITKAARSIGIVDHVSSVFENETRQNKKTTDLHNTPPYLKDFKCVLDKLMKENVYQRVNGRKHSSYRSLFA